MLNLLIKDFKLLFQSGGSLKARVIQNLLRIIMLIVFVGFESFLFVMILNKVGKYPHARESFLILFLFVISCMMIILDLLTANKLFFNERDNELMHYPISNEEIITSKLVFLFGMHYITGILFTYPILLAYGRILGRTPWYYFLSVFYPALSFFFECGVALILVYPFKLFIDYLKKHIVIQFIASSILMLGGCLLYSWVLKTFMNLVVSNNLNALFTTEALESLRKATSYMVPIGLLVKSYLGISRSMLPYICLGLGIFILGLMIQIFTYSRLRSLRFNSKPKRLKRALRVRGVGRMLIDKELSLLFKDSSNIFSFSGLLLVQPFLMFLVIDALNGVLSSGAFQYYMLALPQFIPLMDIVLVMLFTLIINSGANNYISNETKTMKIMKTIPVHYGKQLLIKALVPYVASASSLLISEIVLIATGTINVEIFIASLILSITLLAVFELVSLAEELKIRSNKPRGSFLSSLYSYLIPFGFFVISLILSNLKINSIFIYLIGLVVILLLALPFLINIKKRVMNEFMDLEVIN